MSKKTALLILVAVLLAIVIYIFYARYQAQAPSSVLPNSTSSYPTFQGPPPGSVPYVKGPTAPPPGYDNQARD